MDFKMFRGNKIGGAVLLLFVVLISQSRTLDVLFESALGRTLLVGLIVATSYVNKILGIVSVLLFIIGFSNSWIMEGMEKMTATDTKDTTTVNKKAKEEVVKAKEGFDLLGKEDMMRRSKESKKIPVQKTTNKVEGFEPFDDEFTSYSTF